MAFCALGPIRDIYIALHQDTDSAPTQFSVRTTDQDHILGEPSSYPLCNVAGHSHKDSALTTFDNTVLPPASLTSPDAPSSSIPALLHVVESLTDVPSLDNPYPAHQTTIPVTPPVLADTVPDIITSGITIPTSEPLSSTFPPAAVDPQHNAHLLAPSDPPNLPSSASSHLVLNNIFPTESHRSMIVTIAPSASPGPTSAPDLGAAAAEDYGGPKPGLCKETDALDLPLVNHAIHASTLEHPLQSPSLPSVADSDVAVAGRSLWEPNAELSGDDPPHASHRRYDIV
ncbi:hypothetical protein BJY52DRAFT_1333260 [Lactarius psammicola]|nr:hypothetical protein BJY52DRAFT_1333260 [Lactarius psammicola]